MRRWGWLLAAVCIGLTACATSVPLQRGQIGALKREASPAEIDRALVGATVVARNEFTEGASSFVARHYRLQTGTRQDMSMVCTPACIPIFITVPIMTDYVVIQRMPSQALHAWGTLEELSKDADAEVSGIMPTVKRLLDEATKKK